MVVLVGIDVHAEPSREPTAAATTHAAHTSHSRERIPSCFCSAASRTSGRSEPSSAATTAEGTEQLGKDVVRVGRGEASASTSSASTWHTAEGEGGTAGEAAASSASCEGVEAAAHPCAIGSSRSEAALEALFAELVIDGPFVLVL